MKTTTIICAGIVALLTVPSAGMADDWGNFWKDFAYQRFGDFVPKYLDRDGGWSRDRVRDRYDDSYERAHRRWHRIHDAKFGRDSSRDFGREDHNCDFGRASYDRGRTWTRGDEFDARRGRSGMTKRELKQERRAARQARKLARKADRKERKMTRRETRRERRAARREVRFESR